MKTEPPNGPPPPSRWSSRKPEAAARLEAARAAWRNCRSGSGCRRRTWSRPNWCAGCAGTGRTSGGDRRDPVEAVEDSCAPAAPPWQRELAVPGWPAATAGRRPSATLDTDEVSRGAR